MDKQTQRLMEERTQMVAQCSLITPPKDDEPDGPPKVEVCSRADEYFCSTFAFPDKKWRMGDCPMCDSFLKAKTAEELKKAKINPIKASKRARG